MNARTPEVSPVGLSLAAGNAAVLRIFAEGPWLATTPQSELARKAGVSPKNIGRTIENFLREALVHCPEPGDRIEITDAGRHALAVADFAAGRGSRPPAAGAAQPADPDALLLPHHAIRPNPLNPRRLNLGEPGQDPPTRDRQELDQLKASIAADLAMGGPGVLQSLVVFPPDADGVHDLSAGERRWRAVGELIGEGVWPEGRPLRALQRERSAGLTAFVALVENGQRSNLSMLEEARAYAALVEETGWSARHAALQTGRDPRSVQQMLQVIRDARPADLRRHQESPEDYTWEDLRRSVQEPKAGADPEAEERQLDVEDVAAPLPDESPTTTPTGPATQRDATRRLTPPEKLALAELAHKIAHQPEHDDWTRVERYWLHRTFADLVAENLIAVTHNLEGGPHARLTTLGRMVMVISHVPKEPGMAEIKILALDAEMRRAEPGDLYFTPWLNVRSKSETPEQPDLGRGPDAAESLAGDDDPAPTNADLDDQEFLTAELLLGDVARGLDSGEDFDPTALLQRAGVKFPLRVCGADRCVVDAAGEPVLDMVGWGDQADDLVNARLLLITTMLNATAATWQSPQGAVLKGQRVAPTDPAVPIRRSITPELITCLEDGARAPSIAAHLRQVYGLDADAYRARWGLPRDYPLVAPNEQYRRSQDMKALGVEVPPLSDDGWEG